MNLGTPQRSEMKMRSELHYMKKNWGNINILAENKENKGSWNSLLILYGRQEKPLKPQHFS